MDDMVKEQHHITTILEDQGIICWGCGLRLILPCYTHIFKCGWCGAVTNKNARKHEHESFRWRRLRDRCFVSTLILFMLFVICGGVWAVYPVVFSMSYFCGVSHSILTLVLSTSTISTFSIAAFRCAGTPSNKPWGSYPAVGKDDLENYTFCLYCSKPKAPQTHHCRSCGMCILDMDHHCPFIGNCVGAANHRYFIAFLFSAVISTMYVSIMSAYVGYHLWPPLPLRTLHSFKGSSTDVAMRMLKEIVIAFFDSAIVLSARGLVLVYLFIASLSVEIGLSVLLWQQLCFIYGGKTYLSQLSSRGDTDVGRKGCQNLFRFLGYPYPASRHFQFLFNTKKIHSK
ncbi:protein S-acyltransferase 11 isoform X1 [Macadamia integrifolia]|uniref:protein S-acyltransferase 11 isoform X1 n=1 Tax=Macadamia integrifolia TaxID=60698 RepID=UPI001C4ED404|nr:protein S-acyltransferase 11 isoform X1 [Macadamia integrifolia]